MGALELLNGLVGDYERIRSSSIKDGKYQSACDEIKLAMMERQLGFYKQEWVTNVENWGFTFVSTLEYLTDLLPLGESEGLASSLLLMDSVIAQRRLKLKTAASEEKYH